MASVVYHISKERNRRVFTHEKIKAEVILEKIMENVRLQLHVLKVKKSTVSVEIPAVTSVIGGLYHNLHRTWI